MEVKKVMSYWLTFWAPGTIVGESWNKKLTEFPDVKKVEWPDNAYAFTVWQREDLFVDGTRYQGDPEQIGPMYYHPKSKIETLEEVKKNPYKGFALVRNMECNHWDKIIWTRWGNWPQPYDGEKMIVLK